MLPRADSRQHHGGCEAVSENRNNAVVRILVGDHGGHGPGIDGMSGGKAGTPPPIGTGLKMSPAIAFKRASPVSGQLDGFHQNVAVNQSVKTKQSGFAESLLMTVGADEVEAGADWYQTVRGADARSPGAHGHLARSVGQLCHRPSVRGDKNRGRR